MNELDKKAKFYQRFAAESKIRTVAELCENSYHLCIFACCRELEKSEEYNYVSLQEAKIKAEEERDKEEAL